METRMPAVKEDNSLKSVSDELLFKKYYSFLVEGNCFTILCWFLPYIDIWWAFSMGVRQTLCSHLQLICGEGSPFSSRLGVFWDIYSCRVLSWVSRHIPLAPQHPCQQNEGSVSSVQSLSWVSLWPHGLQNPRPPCPSPTPGVYSNSCLLSHWVGDAIQPSHPMWSPSPSAFSVS